MTGLSREDKVRRYVRHYARLGILVGPTDISNHMGWHSSRMNSIPGWATEIRQEELIAAGFTKVGGRWWKAGMVTR